MVAQATWCHQEFVGLSLVALYTYKAKCSVACSRRKSSGLLMFLFCMCRLNGASTCIHTGIFIIGLSTAIVATASSGQQVGLEQGRWTNPH